MVQVQVARSVRRRVVREPSPDVEDECGIYERFDRKLSARASSGKGRAKTGKRQVRVSEEKHGRGKVADGEKKEVGWRPLWLGC